MTPVPDVPSCPGPRRLLRNLWIPSAVVAAGCSEPSPDPRRYMDGHGIADELPSERTARHLLCRKCPVRNEALHSFCIAEVGCDDLARREQNRGWRGDAYRRSALQCRHRIHGPTEAARAFSPVEAEGVVGTVRRLIRRSYVVGEENRPRVMLKARQQEDAFAALRQPERA